MQIAKPKSHLGYKLGLLAPYIALKTIDHIPIDLDAILSDNFMKIRSVL